MKRLPLVSIIIPTYNRAHLIEETLDSVLAQTYTNWECLVIDDGSTDDTPRILAEYCAKDARFQYHHRPEDRLPGGNAARNYGFELSKGEYIQWFDDDDVMLPEFLEIKEALFTDDVDLVVCSGSYADNKLTNLKGIDLSIETFLFKDYVLWKAHILTPSILFRKSFLIDKLLFNTEIYRGQETELFSRLFFELSDKRYIIINRGMFLYRQHETTKTYKNRVYDSSFKYSQSYIYVENLKRALKLKDKELVNHCLQTLVVHFSNSLKNKDFLTSRYIYTRLVPILKKSNFKFYLEFKIIGSLMLIFKVDSYLVYKRWKSIQI